MKEIINTSLTAVEPQILELGGDFLKEAGESIVGMPGLFFEDVSHQTSFWRERDRVLKNRDFYRFFSDHEITTPRIGQVPERPTRKQENRKATFSSRALISMRLIRLRARRALPASGIWPTFETNPFDLMRLLHKKGQIFSGLEVS
jgi:hypothetical protein